MNNPSIYIEAPNHSDLLNMMVSEMVNQNYTLKSIDTYVSQIETFLNTLSGMETTDIKSYLSRIKSDSTIDAIHFFFRDILANFEQNKWCKPTSI